MSHYRTAEFEVFARNASVRKMRFGNLVMVGDDVYSYAMKIAEVDRVNKIVYFDDTRRSKTTSMHQGAVMHAYYRLKPDGWKYVPMYLKKG